MNRVPMPPRSQPLPPGTGFARKPPEGPRVQQRRAPIRRGSSGRSKTFPPAVAALIDARDLWCVKCGSLRDLHRHHRRIKGSGGDSRPHTDCPCNSVVLCREHHEWAHSGKGRREAEAEGFIIPRSETRPWTQPVMVRTEEESDSGFSAWPTCDGGWVFEAPEGVEAA